MWTKNQNDAIYAPVSNLLVTAAAGSGKTAVMVERIIKRILSNNGVDIDKILVVTFTNAAASEIKERIHLRIIDELDKDSENPTLIRQLALIDNASICTIHSFCLNLIKENFNTLSIDPDFKTGDVSEIESLKVQAIKTVFDEYYEKDDSLFLQLIKLYSPKTDKKLSELIKRFYDFSRTLSSPDDWKKSISDRYNSFAAEEYKKILIDKAKTHFKLASKIYKKAMTLAKKYEMPLAFIDFLNNEYFYFENFDKHFDDWDELFKYSNNLKLPRLTPTATKDANRVLLDEINEYRTFARDELKKCIGIFDVSNDDIEDEFSHCKIYVQKIIEIVNRVDEVFTDIKLKRNIIDFSDYEHLALKILQDENKYKSDIANEVSKKYLEIYVDEYQDCNEIQDKIFSLISNGKNVFMVGDIKQSIYKFRDAAPMIFKEKTDCYDTYDEKIYHENSKISLNKNFRSRKTVLDAVNIIFTKIMSDTVGEMEYLPDAYLYENDNEFYQDDLYKNVSVNVIDYEKNFNAQNDSDNEETIEDVSKICVEASFVAQKINSLIESKTLIYDKNLDEKRPINYGDIVVLMRSAKDSAKVFEEVFKNNKIPSFSDAGDNYYESIEIKTLISFIKVILNPIDDINLTAVMRSSIYKFDDDELLKIRLCVKNSYFYDAVLEYSKKFSDDLSKKINTFFADLDKFKTASRRMTSDAFLRFVVRETDYLSYVGTLPLAEQKKANLRMLFYKAECFECDSYKGIFNFVNYIEQASLKKGEGDSPKLTGENDNVVRIMTIHKSKGLEFGVVFLCQCAKKFNFTDTTGDMLLHKKLGIGLNYIDYEKRFCYPTVIKRAIAEKMNLETLSEEQRILYVALTRAREKLYICGTFDKAQQKIDSYKNLLDCFSEVNIPIAITKDAKTYFDWIIPALIKHFEESDKILKLNIIPSHSIDIAEQEDEEIKTNFFNEYADKTSDYTDIIQKRLSYIYPFDKSCTLPSNITVTEIKRLFSEENDGYNIYSQNIIKKPKFIEKESLSAAKKGTVMHFVMQKIDFSAIKEENDIKNQIVSFVQKEFITEEEAKSIDVNKILAFVNSDIGMKMKKAKSVEREFSFKIPIKLRELFDVDIDDEIVLQGAIDAYFENENGDIVIVDYKTDKVKSKEEIKKRYEVQLKYYKYALEKILSKKVSDTIIYLFDTGEII